MLHAFACACFLIYFQFVLPRSLKMPTWGIPRFSLWSIPSLFCARRTPVVTVRNKVHTGYLCQKQGSYSSSSLSSKTGQIFYRIHFVITVKAHDGLPQLPAVKICSVLFVTRSKTCRKRKVKNTREKQKNVKNKRQATFDKRTDASH